MTTLLKYSKDNVPHACLALIAHLKLGIRAQEAKDMPKPTLFFYPGTDSVAGEPDICRFLARFSESPLYAGSATALATVDAWMGNEDNLEEFLARVNERLALRTYVAWGRRLSIADFLIFGRVLGGGEVIANKGKLMYVRRWLAHMKGIAGIDANPIKKKVVKTKYGAMGQYSHMDNEAEGTVVTRFPPEPSGYLHIGHVKAAMLNDHYAKSNKGRMLLRFDDTNPATEKAELIQPIIDDLGRLGITCDSVSHTSDLFDTFIEYAEKFIRNGYAYVDDTPIDEMREQRMAGKPGARRDASVEDNLKLWDEMVRGTALGQTCVLRAKIDIASPNTAMRDPSMYRCKPNVPHYRTGLKYNVYPLYDFVCPIIDSLEGVTHALRSNEYSSRNPLYTWVAKHAGLRVPKIEDFSRLNFEYVLLSKRKLQRLVDTGVVGGWDDPRFPTIRGVLRRGLDPQVLREFILSVGGSKNSVLMTMDKLWILNKKAIDKVVPRHVALPCKSLIALTLTGADAPTGIDVRSVPLHPKNASVGNRAAAYCSTLWLDNVDVALLKEGDEITLVNWGNVIVDKITPEGVHGHLHLAGDPSTTEYKLTWLPRIEQGTPQNDGGHLVHVITREYGFLITKKTLRADDDFDAAVNKNSLLETAAYGDQSMRLLKHGDKLQLLRTGFFIVDKVGDGTKDSPIELIKIPDGTRGPLSPPEDDQ